MGGRVGGTAISKIFNIDALPTTQYGHCALTNDHTCLTCPPATSRVHSSPRVTPCVCHSITHVRTFRARLQAFTKFAQQRQTLEGEVCDDSSVRRELRQRLAQGGNSGHRG